MRKMQKTKHYFTIVAIVYCSLSLLFGNLRIRLESSTELVWTERTTTVSHPTTRPTLAPQTFQHDTTNAKESLGKRTKASKGVERRDGSRWDTESKHEFSTIPNSHRNKRLKRNKESEVSRARREQRLSYNTAHNLTHVNDRTVLFVHFHKAGGTSTVEKFRLEGGYQMWQPNGNGNPMSTPGKCVRFWHFSRSQFEAFLQDGKNRGDQRISSISSNVEFLAMEWNFFTQDHFFERDDETGESWLRSRAKLDVITVMRDPYDRFVSNFFFKLDNPNKEFSDPLGWSHLDLARKDGMYHSISKPRRFNEHGKMVNDVIPLKSIYGEEMSQYPFYAANYNKPNYYTAFLNGFAENNNEDELSTNPAASKDYDFEYFAFGLNQTHLEVAKDRLRRFFDVIIILDRPETHKLLQPWFAFLHYNSGGDNRNDLAGLEEDANTTLNYSIPHSNKGYNKRVIALTREEFYKYNALDKELFDYAVELSLSKLKKLDHRPK